MPANVPKSSSSLQVLVTPCMYRALFSLTIIKRIMWIATFYNYFAKLIINLSTRVINKIKT